MRLRLLLFSAIFLILFTLFSYQVAKETFQRIDFDTMVKLQDRTPQKYDEMLSFFSLLGSVEVTFGFCFILALMALFKGRWLVTLGWLMILPATAAEVFGKLILFHPGPPYFFHRSELATTLPSFAVHTNFSYPSGHMTRIAFIATTLFILILLTKKNPWPKYLMIFMIILIVGLMALSRISLGEHWLSDVLGGILLGITVGLFASIFIVRRV
ncbi:phosphatase PAP2 family protein [Candidatus Daviesbacteria bacterium]|nr:phosphatase PAP2 family protein [Candidatus Daviesbacteria bacterium]